MIMIYSVTTFFFLLKIENLGNFLLKILGILNKYFKAIELYFAEFFIFAKIE